VNRFDDAKAKYNHTSRPRSPIERRLLDEEESCLLRSCRKPCLALAWHGEQRRHHCVDVPFLLPLPHRRAMAHGSTYHRGRLDASQRAARVSTSPGHTNSPCSHIDSKYVLHLDDGHAEHNPLAEPDGVISGLPTVAPRWRYYKDGLRPTSTSLRTCSFRTTSTCLPADLLYLLLTKCAKIRRNGDHRKDSHDVSCYDRS